MLALERVELDALDWTAMDAMPDRVVFQTRAWIDFIAETQDAEPVVARILDGQTAVGYFTGLVVRRSGVRILGSPFPGWTTGNLGFNLEPGVPRGEAAAALVPFAFKQLGCLHLELKDRRLGVDDVAGLKFAHNPTTLLEVDLDREEEQVFAAMTSACRRAVRKATKVGVQVEEAAGPDFADEYHAQLTDVFARQGLKPTYDVERVRALIRHVHPTGNLLLLRARSPDGAEAATGIFPGFNDTAYFWGGASWKDQQIHRPNEALFWYAMRHWRARGMKVMDLGGGGDYKLKYGPTKTRIPFFRRSRIPGLEAARQAAKRAVRLRQRVR